MNNTDTISLNEELIMDQIKEYYKLQKYTDEYFQLLVPYYYSDGDMVEIFIKFMKQSNQVLISDLGSTLMRLSYAVDTTKTSVNLNIDNIVKEESVMLSEDGILSLTSPFESLIRAINRLFRCSSKIMGLTSLGRNVQKSMFYEEFFSVVEAGFNGYTKIQDYVPVKSDDAYTVDFRFIPENKEFNREIFVFSVKDTLKARDVTSTILFCDLNKVKYTSLIVYDDFSVLTNKDQRKLMNVTDKNFYKLEDFQKEAENYLNRLIA